MLGQRLAAAAAAHLREHGVAVNVEEVDLRDHAHDLADNLLTGLPAAPLSAAIERVSGADALVAVTPVFTASYSGLFKSFFDVLEPDALAGKWRRPGSMRTEDWGSGGAQGTALADRIDRAAEELGLLMAGHPVRPKLDPYDNPTPLNSRWPTVAGRTSHDGGRAHPTRPCLGCGRVGLGRGHGGLGRRLHDTIGVANVPPGHCA